MKYYVYAYLREDGSPYYIGKGTGYRATSKHNVKVPPRWRIVYLAQNLTEVGALAIERRFIEWYGRKVDGGPLRNLTTGGDGVNGVKHDAHTYKMIGEKVSGAWNDGAYKDRAVSSNGVEAMKRWRADNPDKVREYGQKGVEARKKWNKDNPDQAQRIIEQAVEGRRVWAESNRDEMLDVQRKASEAGAKARRVTIEHEGTVYHGWKELKKATGITPHLFKKNGLGTWS